MVLATVVRNNDSPQEVFSKPQEQRIPFGFGKPNVHWEGVRLVEGEWSMEGVLERLLDGRASWEMRDGSGGIAIR